MKSLFSNKKVFTAVSFFISLFVLMIFVKSPGINGYERAMFPEMIYGTAWKPFVYRTLLPSAVRGIVLLIPNRLQDNISAAADQNEFAVRVLSKLNWESEFLTEYIIAFILMFLSLWGFAFIFKKFFKSLLYMQEHHINLITIIVLLALPVMFKYYSYIYDFPSLLLFTAGMYLMVKQDWKKFLLIFFVACINKETTILLTLIFAIHFYKSEILQKKKFNQLIIIQLLIFFAVKTALFFAFKSNSGAFIEFHFFDHNIHILNGYNLTEFFLFIFTALMIFYKWEEKPKYLKDAIWIAVPLIILTIFLGFADELRDYYEAFPVAAILIAHSLALFLGIDIKPVEQKRGGSDITL